MFCKCVDFVVMLLKNAEMSLKEKGCFFSLCYWKMGQKIKESESYWVINIRDNNLMSSLQKYTRTKKKTVNCITTVDPFLLGGRNQYCWRQSERTNHTFYRRMVCATHRCYKKSCEIYQVYSWNSDLILFLVSAVSSESCENLPWWQSVCVEKSLNVNLVVKAFFSHNVKSQVLFLQLLFHCFLTAKSHMALNKILNSYLFI